MSEIWKTATEQLVQGRPLALATILAVNGSCPRDVGTRLLIDEAGKMVGTIGGGSFEARVRELALSAIETRTSYREVFSFCAGEMVCGGEGDVLVEYVDGNNVLFHEIIRCLADITQTKGSAYLVSEVPMPVGGSSSYRLNHSLMDRTGLRIGELPECLDLIESMRRRRALKAAQLTELAGWECPVLLEWIKPTGTVYMFGAGHVGVWVARFASFLDFKVIVLDDRSEFASSVKIPEADEIIVLDSYGGALSDLPIDDDSYLIIVTRGHAYDKAVLEQALRTPARYIGMIGSRRKTAVVFQTLLKEGFSEEDFRRVHSPIGLHIGGETPQELAVAIIAEMIQTRSGIGRRREQAGTRQPDLDLASTVSSDVHIAIAAQGSDSTRKKAMR